MSRAVCFVGILTIVCGAGFAPRAAAADLVVEVSKPLEGGRGLGTMGYPVTKTEEPFLQKVTEKPVNLWSNVELPKPSNVSDAEWAEMLKRSKEIEAKMIPVKEYELAKQAGEYVGWFGIVRDAAEQSPGGPYRLLVEHKYFDGMTDLHLQVVSIYGAGDFAVLLPKKRDDIPRLGLIRVYGRVAKTPDGVATVTPEYIRVWPWGLFTFMDYGLDKSNAKWRKLRKVSGDDVYSPRPDQKFYEDRLGPRKAAD